MRGKNYLSENKQKELFITKHRKWNNFCFFIEKVLINFKI
jgi:hypothetical protein